MDVTSYEDVDFGRRSATLEGGEHRLVSAADLNDSIDPDGGNGALEWTIAVGLLALAVALAVLARRQWRHLLAASRFLLTLGWRTDDPTSRHL
jgi:hypothetical protein